MTNCGVLRLLTILPALVLLCGVAAPGGVEGSSAFRFCAGDQPGVGVACDRELLEALFGPEWNSRFFEDAFEQRQHHVVGSPLLRSVVPFSLDDFGRLIESSLQRDLAAELARAKDGGDASFQQLDMMRGLLEMPTDIELVYAGGAPSRHLREQVRDRLRQLQRAIKADRKVIPAATWVALASEYNFTIIIRDADGRHPRLGAFADRLRRALGLQVGISLYYTPPGRRGVEPHIDDMDVIAVQAYGSKTWKVEESAQRCPLLPIKKLTPDHRLGPKHAKPETIALGEGELLYVPRGMIHNATAGPEGSLHISVGIEPLPLKILSRFALEVVKRFADGTKALVPESTVPATCASPASVAQMAIQLSTTHDWRWRRALPRPQDAIGDAAACAAVTDGDKSPLAVWAAAARAQTLARVKALAADFELGGNTERPGTRAAVVEALLGEGSLMKHLDAWFDNARCPQRATQIAAAVGQWSAREPKFAFKTASAAVADAVSRLEKMLLAEWCGMAVAFHNAAAKAEQETLQEEANWSRLNYKLFDEYPLSEPIVVPGASGSTTATPSSTSSDDL